jgi:hypothetical protein
MFRRATGVIGAVLLLIISTYIRAQETTCEPPADMQKADTQEKEKRPTGLPKKLKWTFNFDAAWGAFGFGNSLYTNVRPDPSGNLRATSVITGSRASLNLLSQPASLWERASFTARSVAWANELTERLRQS